MTLLVAGARRRSGQLGWAPGGFGATPFETAGVPTALTTEADYLETLATHPNVTLSTIATTVQGRAVLALRIGTGAGMPVAVVAGTHAGTEPATREAAHKFARDLINSTDPAIHQFLTDRSVYVIPTVNPDGYVAGTRENGNGADINRDFVEVIQPESRGLATLFRDIQPFAYVDVHENPWGTGAAIEYESGTVKMMPLNVYEYGLTALQRSVIAGLNAATIDNNWNVYPPVAGQYNQTATSTFGLVGVHTTLLESNIAEGVTVATRIARHMTAIDAWWGDVLTYADTYEATTLAGKADRAANVNNGAQWEIGGWYASLRYTAKTGTTVTASAYTLTANQRNIALAAMTAHGIEATTVDGGTTYTVSLDQEAAAIAVYLLDPSSPARAVDGTRIP